MKIAVVVVPFSLDITPVNSFPNIVNCKWLWRITWGI